MADGNRIAAFTKINVQGNVAGSRGGHGRSGKGNRRGSRRRRAVLSRCCRLFGLNRSHCEDRRRAGFGCQFQLAHDGLYQILDIGTAGFDDEISDFAIIRVALAR